MRRRLNGVVTSAKMMKTIIVEVKRTFQHPLYGKVVHAKKRYKVHDELGCLAGDKVVIIESRPISKEKRFVVEKIVQRAEQSFEAEEGA